MRFGSPYFLWLLAAIPLLIGFFIWAFQQKRKALNLFVSAKLMPRLVPGYSTTRQTVRWTLWVCFFFFVVLALSRPRFGVKMEMLERKGTDVMVALDISESMLAEDIAPNRIERAKHEIEKFIDLLKGDRFGLIVFAGEAFVQCPLTLDYGAAKMFLDVVTTDWVQVQGTVLGDAIELAMKSSKIQSKKGKVLILITDGEDHETNAVEMAKKAASEGIKIYTIGIGSTSGVPIPTQKSGGSIVYKKDNSGNLVMTRLDPAMLQQIAAAADGRYFEAGTDLDLVTIYNEILKLEKADLGLNKMSVYEEQYQFFLALAFILLMIEFFIPERSRRETEWRGRVA